MIQNLKHTRILIVDDDEHYLASLRRLLYDHIEIFTTTGPLQALKILEAQGPFPVIISDYQMPFMNGIEFFSKISLLDKDAQKIMLTGYASLQIAIDAINQGIINAFLTKPTPASSIRSVILNAIITYNEKQIFKSLSTQAEANQLAKKPCSALCHPLTTKEQEILALVAKGFSNAEIALALTIRIGTVKTHINNVFGKMDVNSRTKIIARGIELGLIKNVT